MKPDVRTESGGTSANSADDRVVGLDNLPRRRWRWEYTGQWLDATANGGSLCVLYLVGGGKRLCRIVPGHNAVSSARGEWSDGEGTLELRTWQTTGDTDDIVWATLTVEALADFPEGR